MSHRWAPLSIVAVGVAGVACGATAIALVDVPSAEDGGPSPDAPASTPGADGIREPLDAGTEPDVSDLPGPSCGSTSVPPGDRCFPLNVSCACAGGRAYGCHDEQGLPDPDVSPPLPGCQPIRVGEHKPPLRPDQPAWCCPAACVRVPSRDRACASVDLEIDAGLYVACPASGEGASEQSDLLPARTGRCVHRGFARSFYWYGPESERAAIYCCEQ